MEDKGTETDAVAGACKYLLLVLIQRLEADRPGLLDEISSGIAGDRAAIERNGELSDQVLKIFAQVESLLAQARQ